MYLRIVFTLLILSGGTFAGWLSYKMVMVLINGSPSFWAMVGICMVLPEISFAALWSPFVALGILVEN